MIEPDKSRTPVAGCKEKQAAVLAEKGLPFAELHQTSDLQGALLSYRLEDGAIQRWSAVWTGSPLSSIAPYKPNDKSGPPSSHSFTSRHSGRSLHGCQPNHGPAVHPRGWQGRRTGNDYDGGDALRALQNPRTLSLLILEKTSWTQYLNNRTHYTSAMTLPTASAPTSPQTKCAPERKAPAHSMG